MSKKKNTGKKVILVDKNDDEIGEMEKMEAHVKGKLHRAFSVFIFNSEGKLLIQKRAKKKYHSGGLWTNTCCSHPVPKEETKKGAIRRLEEEMGIRCNNLKEVYKFIYKKKFSNGLIEYEYDHVFFGKSNKEPVLNAEEVEIWKWIDIKNLKKEIKNNSKKYTYWLKKCFDDVLKIKENENENNSRIKKSS